MDKQKIQNFYDEFAEDQLDVGVNDRIAGLYKRIKKLGLKSNSNVLELGCGVGTMTYLLLKTVRTGQIEAVDLSERSVKIASQKLVNTKVKFVAADVVGYKPNLQTIDFITLFDVIEHIPIGLHPQLFQNLASLCSNQTKILINIPNPAYLAFDHIHHPETLQVIDQPIPFQMLINNIYQHKLTLTYFDTYSIWAKDDYQFFVIEKDKPFEEILLSTKRNTWQKATKKLERTLMKMRFRYK